MTRPGPVGNSELIEALSKAGFARAVGSSGPPENVALCLEKLGCRSLIEAEVNGMDVTRGKPDPQVFQLGAERMGIPARQCVVVEDARAGIAAAHAAGMRCVALVSTGRTRDELADADVVVDSLLELTPATVRELIQRGSQF